MATGNPEVIMMNAYERLGLERGLVLDEEELRAAFDRVSGSVHPDAGGDREEFARVREAHGTLRSPGKRLRHWLETGGVAWEIGGSVPEGLLESFGVIGDLVQQVDGLVAGKAAAQSALRRSMLEREGMELLERVEKQLGHVQGMRENLVGGFGEFERAGARACADEAAEAARTLAFLEKWEGQLRERWAGLAM